MRIRRHDQRSFPTLVATAGRQLSRQRVQSGPGLDQAAATQSQATDRPLQLPCLRAPLLPAAAPSVSACRCYPPSVALPLAHHGARPAQAAWSGRWWPDGGRHCTSRRYLRFTGTLAVRSTPCSSGLQTWLFARPRSSTLSMQCSAVHPKPQPSCASSRTKCFCGGRLCSWTGLPHS